MQTLESSPTPCFVFFFKNDHVTSNFLQDCHPQVLLGPL